MEEQLREDEQELEVCEQMKKEKDAKRIRAIVHENDRQSFARGNGKLMYHDEQTLLSLWQGWHWGDTKGGWLDPKPCAKARREEVESVRHHKMYTRVPRGRRTCVRRKKRPSRRDGWRPTRDNQGSPMCARGGVAKPRLEALKVVLSEAATGKLGGKVVALVDVRRAYFYAPGSRAHVYGKVDQE